MPYLDWSRLVLWIIKWLHWGSIALFILFSGVLPDTSKYFLVLASVTTFCLVFCNAGRCQKFFWVIDSKTKNLVLVYFIFLLLILPSVFIVEDYHPGLKLWFSFLSYLMAFFVGRFSGGNGNRNLERALLFMLSFSLFVFSSNVVNKYFAGIYRPGGFGLDSGASASYISLLIIILWTLGLESFALSRIGRIICFFAAVTGIVALTVILQRGPWFSTILTLVIFGVIKLRRSWKRLVGQFLLLFIVFSALFVLIRFTPAILQAERFNIDLSLKKQDTATQSIAERFRLWGAAKNMFIEHPLLGVGLCQFQNEYKTIYAPPDAIRRDLPQAHNNFLQFLSETGLVGFSGFIIMTGYLLLSLFRLSAYKRPNYWFVTALLITLSEIFFSGMANYTFILSPTARIFWFVIGVAYAQINQHRGGNCERI